MRAVGASGFPSAVVVDAQGNIAYSGHPASINASVLKPLLKGALKTPMYEWPKSCSKVAKALRKGNLGDAIKASAKIEEEHPDIAAAVVGMADGRLATMEKAAKAGKDVVEKGKDVKKIDDAKAIVGDKLKAAAKTVDEKVEGAALEADKTATKIQEGNKKAKAALKEASKAMKAVEKDTSKIKDQTQNVVKEGAKDAAEKVKEVVA